MKLGEIMGEIEDLQKELAKRRKEIRENMTRIRNDIHSKLHDIAVLEREKSNVARKGKYNLYLKLCNETLRTIEELHHGFELEREKIQEMR